MNFLNLTYLIDYVKMGDRAFLTRRKFSYVVRDIMKWMIVSTIVV